MWLAGLFIIQNDRFETSLYDATNRRQSTIYLTILDATSDQRPTTMTFGDGHVVLNEVGHDFNYVSRPSRSSLSSSIMHDALQGIKYVKLKRPSKPSVSYNNNYAVELTSTLEASRYKPTPGKNKVRHPKQSTRTLFCCIEQL